MEHVKTSGLCWRCNYPLHSAFERKCPECGRAFDPADPRTMNMGPPVGRLTRFIVAATGWPTIALAALATAALVYVTGWPLLFLRPSTEELAYLLNFSQWSAWYEKPDTISTNEWVTLACVVVWVLIVLLGGFRWLVRLAVVLRHRRCFELTKSRKYRLVFVPLLLAATLLLLVHGWPNRVADAWAYRQAQGWTTTTGASGQHQFIATPGTTMQFIRWSQPDKWDLAVVPPLEFYEREVPVILRHAVEHLRSRRHRTAALGLLLAHEEERIADDLARWTAAERDPQVRVTMMRVLALCRRPTDLDTFAALLDHDDPAIRAAAADAVGINRVPYHLPVYDPFYFPYQLPVIASDPPIAVHGLFKPTTETRAEGRFVRPFDPWATPKNIVAMPPAVLERLRTMMLTGATMEEREAAARAVLSCPPENYTLRVAEWGVWLAEGGDLKLAKSIIDEVPPFVHRTGNPYAEFTERLIFPSVVTKPILHVYASGPMSIDVQVLIRQGRPRFAYPMPDDFHVDLAGPNRVRGPGKPQPALVAFDGVVDGTPFKVSEGYPWFQPSHRKHVTGGMTGTQDIMHIGLRWQSAVVTGEQPAGIQLPVVGDDPRFAWWSRLREVKSNYVTSRGETERFLYYDGPTLASAGVSVVYQDGVLVGFTIAEGNMPAGRRQPDRGPDPSKSGEHAALYIQVDSARMRGERVTLPAKVVFRHPLSNLDLTGEEQVRAALLAMLTDKQAIPDGGLTEAEANGLIDAWVPHLFQTAGKRLIMRMTRGEYDNLCPIDITPKPTTLTRVGLILFEFPAETPE